MPSPSFFDPVSAQGAVREARSLLGNAAAIVVNSSYLAVREYCRHLEMGLGDLCYPNEQWPKWHCLLPTVRHMVQQVEHLLGFSL